jgi:hypothetical protein
MSLFCLALSPLLCPAGQSFYQRLCIPVGVRSINKASDFVQSDLLVYRPVDFIALFR